MSTLFAQDALVVPFERLRMSDVEAVGGKNASLGEMISQLPTGPLGVRVPTGFATTAHAFRVFLAHDGLDKKINALLDALDTDDVRALAVAGSQIRALVEAQPFPSDFEQAVRTSFAALSAGNISASFAVRSSATAEDLPDASFAGQQETFLNVVGIEDVLHKMKEVFASLYNDRAISYRVHQGFAHADVALSAGVQRMVRSDLGAAGVMFTIDTESGFEDVVFITSSYGLGETVVQGAVNPDEFYVHKPMLKAGNRAVIRRNLGSKLLQMEFTTPEEKKAGGKLVKTTDVPTELRNRYSLADADVEQLARYAVIIEDHYGRPMDIEWAKDGPDGKLYIVQARPETAASQRSVNVLEEFVLDGTGTPRAKGRAVGARVASGNVRLVKDGRHLSEFKPGEVLVADTTTPDWEPVMKTAAAIVTNRGGRTCHAAIIARELGIPAVVGAEHATETLHNGEPVTVSCAEGAIGRVYEGLVPFHKLITDVTGLQRPATHIMVNLGNPELAFQTSLLPCDGVGLARMEFIINEHIKVHPMAVLHPERIVDQAERARVQALWAGYPDGASYFVEKLAEGVGTIAAAFYPRPVIVRLSDFKSNEYAALMGGRDFEPREENPMIGFRGAARYIHPAYAEGFALECLAMRKVRETMGLTNLKLMVPFCRRLDEARRVLDAMAAQGLRRGQAGLEVYVMCEIPNNVLLIDEFSELFDGFSIGSNDLTQLTLGVDRDSAIVAESFDERDPGMLKMLKMAVEGARRNKRHSGICGQAPSDHVEIAQYLVELGIDSISLTPDTVLKTTQAVVDIERKLGRLPRA